MLDLQDDAATCHHLDLVLFGEFHSQRVHLGAADGDYEMVEDTCFLSRNDHLDDVVHHDLLPAVHVGCDLLVVLYGGLILELHFRDLVTFGLEKLAYASETASLEIPLGWENHHYLARELQRLAYSAEQDHHLDPPSSIFCISIDGFETKSLPVFDLFPS